jgi:hypothetical protein
MNIMVNPAQITPRREPTQGGRRQGDAGKAAHLPNAGIAYMMAADDPHR